MDESAARTGNRPCEKPDPTVAKANKLLTSRFYQFKTGHCLTASIWLGLHADRTPPAGGASTVSRPGSIFSRTAPNGEASKRPSGRPSWRRRGSSPAPPGVGNAQASRSCSPTSGAARWYWIFSQTQTSAGRPAHRWQEKREEDEAANEASEWEAREQAERDWERMEEEVRLGAEL